MATTFATKFTAHNVRLDDGTETFPEAGATMDQMGNYHCVRKFLQLVYPEGYAGKSIVDLGCLEGGFATEFARLGLDSTGIDVRASNIENCEFIRSRTNLPNLKFICDNAWNVAAHGPFDAVFCVGLHYHIEDQRRFLGEMGKACRKVIFVDTHFAPEFDDSPAVAFHSLSPLDRHEGLPGRWYVEHDLDAEKDEGALQELKWASWENHRSFWPTKGALVQSIRDAGFDIVLEDYDPLDLSAVEQLAPGGVVHQHSRSMFVGVKLDQTPTKAGGWLRRLLGG